MVSREKQVTKIRQNRLQDKKGNKRQRQSFYNDEGTNTSQRHNTSQYICTQLEAPSYIKQLLKELKGETDKNTITVGDLNTPLTAMGRSSKQKIKKNTVALNDTLDHMDLINIFQDISPQTEECKFFPS